MLKNKILLRGKACSVLSQQNNSNVLEIDNEMVYDCNKSNSLSSIDPAFSRLISLPSVKLSSNLYDDIRERMFFSTEPIIKNFKFW